MPVSAVPLLLILAGQAPPPQIVPPAPVWLPERTSETDFGSSIELTNSSVPISSS